MKTFVLPLCAALLSVHLAAQSPGKPERFTALAIPPSIGPPVSQVDIIVERWSTEAERDQLLTAIRESKTKGALDVLRKLPRVASFGATGFIGYPARFAWKEKGEDGIERITIITDRNISFGEAVNQPRSVEYPITYIDLRLKPNGEGEGDAYVAAQLAFDRFRKSIIVENYDFQSVKLTALKRLK